MLFNSYEFIFLFLPICLLGYIAMWKYGSRRLSLVWLIAASLFFYGWWNPAYLGLILGSMLFNYSIGLVLSSNQASNKRSVLLVGITSNILLLGYYKYANFFVDNINYALSINWNVEHIILPLAISFFTFQQVTYLVDAYRGQTREYNFLQYALFVSFFPQLIAGPIVHHREMMPQFSKQDGFTFKYKYIAVGLSVFFIGLFKKVVLADSLSPYSVEVFSAVSNGSLLSFFEAWKGILAYTFQLYFDFSGYSDMAVGAAFMFGIRLPLNFNSPYKAFSIIEFWQRWHMTLSRFLKDYLYIPLGGNRRGKLRRHVNLMITMLIGGLWHGAGWTFVIWGGLHGAYLVINHAWRNLKSIVSISDSNRFYCYGARIITFLAVAFAWVYFRAENVDAANLLTKGLLGIGGVVWPEEARHQLGVFAELFSDWGMRYQYLQYFNGMEHMALIGIFLASVFMMPNSQQIFHMHSAVIDPPKPGKLMWQPNKRWATLIILIAVASILKLGEVSEFLYFQF
ncbi:MAG: MBOAT family protein [Gammaproteobacteria bacterium]|nr:MBOAT family protein [Gammaproteobacteria bacterium]